MQDKFVTIDLNAKYWLHLSDQDGEELDAGATTGVSVKQEMQGQGSIR